MSIVGFGKTVFFSVGLKSIVVGLERQQFTTQIEHYDMFAASFDVLRVNFFFLKIFIFIGRESISF